MSTLDYEVSHQGKYTHICGVDPLWKPYLKDQNIKYNSLEAAWTVYNYYLDKNNGDAYKALLNYKGVQKSLKVKRIAKKIIKTVNKLKD